MTSKPSPSSTTGESSANTTLLPAPSDDHSPPPLFHHQNQSQQPSSTDDNNIKNAPLDTTNNKSSISIPPIGINPFAPPTSHHGVISIIKMVIVGLVLFLPRVILTALLVILMYLSSLLTCYCCCDDGETVSGGYPKHPNNRYIFRFFMRVYVRMMLFVWGFYWISVDHKEVEKTPEGHPTPGIIVANHTSFIEPFIIFYLEGVSALGKIEAVRAPVIGRIVSAMQFLAVDRSNRENRHAVGDEIKRRAKSKGAWPPLLIHPEGTCCNRQAIIKFKAGAFIPLRPVRAMAVDFPNWWCDHAWVGPITVGGAFARMLCQVFNRAHITYLGDISPPKTAEEARQYLKQDVLTEQNMTSVIGENSSSSTDSNNNNNSNDLKSDSSMVLPPDVARHMSEAFAEKVRKVFSDAMQIPMTEHSFDDVRLDYAALVLFPNSNVNLPANLQLGLQNLEYKHAKELLTEFAQFNTSRTGWLNKKEFRKFMGLENHPDLCDEIFTRWAGTEQDKNGKDVKGIDFRNFIQQASVLKMKQIRSQVAVAVQEGADMEMARSTSQSILPDVFSGVFLTFDRDSQDGKVDLDEFKKGFTRIAPFSLEEDKLDALFKEVDKNGDGVVDLQEFIDYCDNNPRFMNYVIDVISRNDVEVAEDI